MFVGYTFNALRFSKRGFELVSLSLLKTFSSKLFFNFVASILAHAIWIIQIGMNIWEIYNFKRYTVSSFIYTYV